MKAEYSEGQFKELDISGNPLEWIAFALAVSQHGVFIPCEQIADLPEKCVSIAEIQVRHTIGKKIKFELVEGQTIVISGDPAFLTKLSETINNLASDPDNRRHIHIDYQGEEHFIDQTSICTVLSRD